jgi:hypothetical protein
MSTTAEALYRLEAEHRRRVREIRQDPALSWEKQERAIRQLGKEYDQARREREAERSAA